MKLEVSNPYPIEYMKQCIVSSKVSSIVESDHTLTQYRSRAIVETNLKEEKNAGLFVMCIVLLKSLKFKSGLDRVPCIKKSL